MFQTFSLDKINSLSSVELDTFKFINNHKSEVIEMSIQDLAKAVFVSTSTIIRLCKKLELEGYSDLKYFLKRQIAEDGQRPAAPSRLTFENIADEELSDIVKTKQGIPKEIVEEIVGLMRGDHKLHFFAKGLTSIVFEYAVRHLLSLSKYAVKYDDTHIAYAQANNLGENDMIFLASMSGETPQVVRVAQIARSKGAKVITFTASLASNLSKIGDYNFLLVNNARSSPEVDTKSRCQLMFILNIIIKMYVEENS